MLTTLVIPIGLLFIIIGISSNSWSHSDSDNIGLWTYCSTFSYIECCESITDFRGYEPDWIKATQAFQIMAFISALSCGIVAIATMCVTRWKDDVKINKIIWISYFVTAFLLVVSVIIYGDNYRKEDWLKDHQLSAAFVLTVTAFLLYLFGGLVLILMIYKGDNRVHTIYISRNEKPRPDSSTTDYLTWLPNRVIRTPDLWTHYDNSKCIDDWTCHAAEVKLKPVSEKERIAIENLVQNTWHRKLVGIGRDANGLDSLAYNRINVTKIERVENPKLFQKYAQERETLFKRVGNRKETLRALENTTNVKSGKVKTNTFVDRIVFRDIYPAVNEHYLFHGTPVEYVDAIVHQGLDARLNKRAAFGSAIYAAESSTKSDSYADPQTERDINTEKKMILLRMLLGEMYVLNDRKEFRRPPCKNCDSDRCADKSHSNKGDWYYDSIVVDGQWNFREFLVFEMSKCYPEYIISYRRVQAN